MITALKRTALACLLTFIALSGQSQLVITPSTNAQALAQKLVGDGITISNITITGTTGNNIPCGFFNHLGGTQLNLDSGIVLTTGGVITSGTTWGVNAPAVQPSIT